MFREETISNYRRTSSKAYVVPFWNILSQMEKIQDKILHGQYQTGFDEIIKGILEKKKER